MSDNAYDEQLKVSDARPDDQIDEPTHRDSIHRISLQTKEGETLIGIPVTIGPTEAVPGVLLAPVRAAMCATALVAKVARLRIVIE